MSDLDKVIHERARLKILTYIAASQKERVSFNELQTRLEFTSGNLSVQLKKLKTARYIDIHKTFKDNKPLTTICMTDQGLLALKSYVRQMEDMISGLNL